jgi:hypothetical protein
VGYETDEERYTQNFNAADVVILGTPIESYEKGMQIHYTVSVEKVWKGMADAYIEIQTHIHGATCGIQMLLNKRVVIFSRKNDGKYHTGLCSGTTNAEGKSELMTWLNEHNGNGVVPIEKPIEPEIDCTPYVCNNGDEYSTCAEDGSRIIYKMHPCLLSETVEEPRGFSDVSESHRNFPAINFVRNEGLVQGYKGGLYKPDTQINRAEFTKIIISANFSPDAIDRCESNDLFSDVTQSDWFADYVCLAKQEDVIGGYPNGSFKPGDFVNFAEASKIVVNAFAINTNPEDRLGAWWKQYVFALSRLGGLPSSFSDPNQLLTRGDMAEIIHRVLMGMGY